MRLPTRPSMLKLIPKPDVFHAWAVMRSEQLEAERQMNAPEVLVTPRHKVVILCPECSRPLIGREGETAFDRLDRHIDERHPPSGDGQPEAV